jgi:hypothetical protein
MRWEVGVLYVEGVAIHGGPEPCVDVPQGRGEALVGVHVGRAIEPRNHRLGCRRRQKGGRPDRQQRYRELLGDPARSENQGMRGCFMRENREVPGSPVGVISRRAAQGRLRPYA